LSVRDAENNPTAFSQNRPTPAVYPNELNDDCRPLAERTAAGRYLEPNLFADMIARRESAG
jgi:hypothetical protein